MLCFLPELVRFGRALFGSLVLCSALLVRVFESVSSFSCRSLFLTAMLVALLSLSCLVRPLIPSVGSSGRPPMRKGRPRPGGPYPPPVRVLGGRPLPSPLFPQVHHHGLLAPFVAGKDQVRQTLPRVCVIRSRPFLALFSLPACCW